MDWTTHTVTLTIPGPAVAKGRHRTTKAGISYTPAKTKQYENLVKLAWQQATKCGPPIGTEYAVTVTATAMYVPPTSWPKWRREMALTLFPEKLTKPDTDNVTKAILDGLNGVAFVDDAQVCRVVATKGYAPTAGVLVKVDWFRIPQTRDEWNERMAAE